METEKYDLTERIFGYGEIVIFENEITKIFEKPDEVKAAEERIKRL